MKYDEIPRESGNTRKEINRGKDEPVDTDQLPENLSAPIAPLELAAQTQLAAKDEPVTETSSPFLRKIGGLAREGILIVLQVIVIFLIIVNFIGRVSIVQGSSMNPCLHSDNRILINLLSYKFSNPARGDIIVFQCPINSKRDYIKRIIALPGETVEIKKGNVCINGKILDEPYLEYMDKTENLPPALVPEDHVYVLGDNRNNSEDSRVWGPVSFRLIKGRARIVFWPVHEMSVLK